MDPFVKDMALNLLTFYFFNGIKILYKHKYMFLKLVNFLTEDNNNKIQVISANGSIFNLNYSSNILLDIDILNLIKSKDIISLHNNINKIINNYDLSKDSFFLVKEFIKWIIFTLNINLTYQI
tara:strand:- start:1 stop:369 length:369 start_codon:yes stop_codon:yes gene_type:complete